jgi:hypothetical protein
MVEHLQLVKDNSIPVSELIWNYSTQLLSELIEIRYKQYNKEARQLLQHPNRLLLVTSDDVLEKKVSVLSHVSALNVFVSQLHADILHGLKVTLPKDLKPNVKQLRLQCNQGGGTIDEDQQVPSVAISDTKSSQDDNDEAFVRLAAPSIQDDDEAFARSIQDDDEAFARPAAPSIHLPTPSLK